MQDKTRNKQSQSLADETLCSFEIAIQDSQSEFQVKVLIILIDSKCVLICIYSTSSSDEKKNGREGLKRTKIMYKMSKSTLNKKTQNQCKDGHQFYLLIWSLIPITSRTFSSFPFCDPMIEKKILKILYYFHNFLNNQRRLFQSAQIEKVSINQSWLQLKAKKFDKLVQFTGDKCIISTIFFWNIKNW